MWAFVLLLRIAFCVESLMLLRRCVLLLRVGSFTGVALRFAGALGSRSPVALSSCESEIIALSEAAQKT